MGLWLIKWLSFLFLALVSSYISLLSPMCQILWMAWRDNDPIIFVKEERAGWSFAHMSQILEGVGLRSVCLAGEWPFCSSLRISLERMTSKDLNLWEDGINLFEGILGEEKDYNLFSEGQLMPPFEVVPVVCLLVSSHFLVHMFLCHTCHTNSHFYLRSLLSLWLMLHLLVGTL